MDTEPPQREFPRDRIGMGMGIGSDQIGGSRRNSRFVPAQSCIIKRYCEKRFVSKYLATIGIDYGVTKVQIWDWVRNEFYKDTQGVLLVYDVGSKESFDSLDSWLAEMKQELGPHGNMDNVVFVVCANKVRDWCRIPAPIPLKWAGIGGEFLPQSRITPYPITFGVSQLFYSTLVDLCDNGGQRPPCPSGLSFTREQGDGGSDVGVPEVWPCCVWGQELWDFSCFLGFFREEVTRAYRKLAVLLHPDKCLAPGSEDAFKAVVNARTALLKNIK
ncbi:dnaJ homolog subfamily C member 27-like [Malurus melanocephalus]|uniref:dnaJ homolog subfamily C member 27-like n=1 Tax=Malurus melanocephalus TaxID=175006 RepID=UPI002547FE7F|nr:dnaJ homolog subfamily C member 27-like [Malurus melanocephalus]